MQLSKGEGKTYKYNNDKFKKGKVKPWAEEKKRLQNLLEKEKVRTRSCPNGLSLS